MATRNFTAVDAAVEFVSLAETKAYLSVAHNDDDALIERLTDAAIEMLGGPSGMLGRCLGKQKWRVALDGFPAGALTIGLPPVQSVESVKYIDREGVEQTLPDTAYRLTGIGRDGTLTPTASWPATADGPEAVTIAFTAGDAAGEASSQLRQLVLALVWSWYESRGVTDTPTGLTTALPFGFDTLVWNWRYDRYEDQA